MNVRHGLPMIALALVGCGDSTLESGKATPTDPRPEDNTPVHVAAVAPPPVSGGTLLVTRDGVLAVAADSDRDRVSIVSLIAGELHSTTHLEAGDEPGRGLVEDSNRRVHVALRRGGAVVAIDLATGEVVSRREVCGAPRGIAYEEATDSIHVACSSGELVTLPAAGGEPVRRLRLDVDLRDVVVLPTGLAVSRFKSGEILFVDPSGNVTGRTPLHGIQRRAAPSPGFENPATAPMEADVAWRTMAAPGGGVFVLHQYALASTIKLKATPAKGEGVSGAPGGESFVSPPDGPVPYGAGGSSRCDGLVHPALSHVGEDATMGAPLAVFPLAVDAALSPDGAWIAIAHASQPQDFPGARITVVPVANTILRDIDSTSCGRALFGAGSDRSLAGQATAIAYNPKPSAQTENPLPVLVAQTRQPASLILFSTLDVQVRQVVDLAGEDVTDTGHALFHSETAAGIACASCHPEGGEDGHVWRFAPTGERRTQALNVGLRGTEPFHWDGDLADVGALVDEVMVRRMGGLTEGSEHKAALRDWLFQLRPLASIVAPKDARATRGRELFDSPAVGCSGCHSGPSLTNNQSATVGTTSKKHPLQVPSLRGIGYRAPFLHNGCAATLRDRFDPVCGGGDAHGKTSHLNDAQLDDLVAYLESV